MSAQSIISQIASIDREIHSIEGQIHSLDGNIARKQKEANSILDKINREKDFKRIITHQKDLTRKNEETSRIEKDKSSKSKTLADKQKKRNELQQQLNKVEKGERDKAMSQQKEILNIQREITREMEWQKRMPIQTWSPHKPAPTQDVVYDVFVSHASEDKEDFVKPFVDALQAKGLKVWYDAITLKVGDSLRASIDKGLLNSRYGIVVLSEAYIKKEWTVKELNGLFAKEIEGKKVILPIWHKITKNEVMNFSPMIADMLALNTSTYSIDELADKIIEAIEIQ
jgi:hypothetical protein